MIENFLQGLNLIRINQLNPSKCPCPSECPIEAASLTPSGTCCSNHPNGLVLSINQSKVTSGDFGLLTKNLICILLYARTQEINIGGFELTRLLYYL